MDEAHILGGGRVRKNTFSLWGRRGDHLNCSGGPEIHQYLQHGEGKMVSGSCFSVPVSSVPRLPWFYLFFIPWVTTYLLFIFRATLALADTLLCLTIYPFLRFTHLGIQFQGKTGDDCSGFFRLSRSTWGSGFLCLLS